MSRKSKARKLGADVEPQRPQPPQREHREPAIQALTQRWVRWCVPVLIALVTFAAFLPTLQNQFVNLDDDKNFLENPRYRGLGWTHLGWMWTTFHLGHYIPLTWMTLGLDYLLWGMNPFGYHLTNLLLHAANAVVFFFIVCRILRLALPRPSERGHALSVAAGFAALVFAIHPLRVESVAWATERRDVLSGLFYLLAILVYLRACERGERRGGWYWGSLALFACGLASKSMVVSLPVVLLILDVYPLRRLGGSVGWVGAPARQVYLEKLPFVLLAGAVSAIAFLALFQIHNTAPLAQLSVLGRLAVSAHGLSFYLGKMVVPLNLSPLYELPRTVNPWARPFVLSYGLALAITAIVLALRRRVPGLPAASLAYVVVLLPVLGIFQNGPQIAADRYTYLAGLGWAILAGAGLLSCWRTSRRSKTGTPTILPIAGVAMCLVVGWGVLTWNQVRLWHDSEKLWTHALAIDPKSSIAQNNFGATLARQGKPAEAIEHYQQALHIYPDYPDAHINWGAALAQQGTPGEAIEHYQQALHIDPGLAAAQANWGAVHYNWGIALAQQGKLVEAIEHFQRALDINPDYADAHYNWGNTLARQGKLAEAIEHFQRALDINPDYASSHNNWGAALAQQGRLTEATDHYRQAVRIKPDYALAHYNWGAALAQQGRLAEAIEHFQEALRIKPDLAEAHDSWGKALAQQGKSAEASAHFQEALRMNRGALVGVTRSTGQPSSGER